jgi:PhnB protein
MDVCTYLFFNGECQSAIDLYVQALGAELLHLSRFADTSNFLHSADQAGMVFHATLRIGSTLINLSDDPQKERGVFGGFALLLHLDREEDVDRIAAGLAKGGRTNLVPQKTTWANRYCIVIDRFGLVWKLQHS